MTDGRCSSCWRCSPSVFGFLVFRVDSMARATFALAVSFVAVGGLLLLLDLDYLGVVVVVMMVMEMAVMAVFMIAYMMNPAGLMPMSMYHGKPQAMSVAVGTFVVLAGGALLVDWPERQGGPPADVTEQVGARDHGQPHARDDGDRRGHPHHDRQRAGAGLGARPVRPARRRPEGAAGPRPDPRRGRPVTLEALLVLASALIAIGLYGALSQQSIVMLMMGLELMLNGVIVAAASFWYFVAPSRPDGQVLVLVVVAAMTIEMAMGFAVQTAVFRAGEVELTDEATELSG